MKQFKSIKLATNLSLGIHISFWAIVLPGIIVSAISIPITAISIDFDTNFLDTLINKFLSTLRFYLVSFGYSSSISPFLPIGVCPLLLTILSTYIFYRLLYKFINFLDIVTIVFIYIFSVISFVILYLIAFSSNNIDNLNTSVFRVLLSLLIMILIPFVVAGIKKENCFRIFKNQVFRLTFRLIESSTKCVLVFSLALFITSIILNFDLLCEYFQIYDLSSAISLPLIFILFLPNLIILSLSMNLPLGSFIKDINCENLTSCPKDKGIELLRIVTIDPKYSYIVYILFFLLLVLIILTSAKKMARFYLSQFRTKSEDNQRINPYLKILLQFSIAFISFFIMNSILFCSTSGNIGKFEIFVSFLTPLIVSCLELFGTLISFTIFIFLNKNKD